MPQMFGTSLSGQAHSFSYPYLALKMVSFAGIVLYPAQRVLALSPKGIAFRNLLELIMTSIFRVKRADLSRYSYQISPFSCLYCELLLVFFDLAASYKACLKQFQGAGIIMMTDR